MKPSEERAAEPVDGEIVATPGAAGGSGVGSDGDLPSQAVHPTARANSNNLRWVLFVVAFSILIRKRESAVKP